MNDPYDDERRAMARCEEQWLRKPERDETAPRGPTVSGPLPSATVGSCACCDRYDTDDGTTPHEVFDVRAWATMRLCRPCLEALAAAIDAALATKETSP